jgi:hypothetical protein
MNENLDGIFSLSTQFPSFASQRYALDWLVCLITILKDLRIIHAKSASSDSL